MQVACVVAANMLPAYFKSPPAFYIPCFPPFNVVPRLEEEPTVAATLADLTCDSDGKVDRFINPRVSRSAARAGVHAS